MSKLTDTLKLFFYDPKTDNFKTTFFNITKALNDNWVKIDAEASKQREALVTLRNNTLRPETRKLAGVPENAVPDDVLRALVTGLPYVRLIRKITVNWPSNRAVDPLSTYLLRSGDDLTGVEAIIIRTTIHDIAFRSNQSGDTSKGYLVFPDIRYTADAYQTSITHFGRTGSGIWVLPYMTSSCPQYYVNDNTSQSVGDGDRYIYYGISRHHRADDYLPLHISGTNTLLEDAAPAMESIGRIGDLTGENFQFTLEVFAQYGGPVRPGPITHYDLPGSAEQLPDARGVGF